MKQRAFYAQRPDTVQCMSKKYYHFNESHVDTFFSSGPRMWGRMNGDWYMCTKGKNQSPINIEPQILLFDPSLKHIVIDGDIVSCVL